MVSEVLKRGKDNAISTSELMNILGFKTKRDLTLQIAKERDAGRLILSSTQGGYYMPQNKQEVKDFVDSRAKNTLKITKAAREFLKRIDGQMTINTKPADYKGHINDTK